MDQNTIEAVYRSGLGSTHGDPEALEDLGIPVTPDTLESHIESGRLVSRLGSTANRSELGVKGFLCGDCLREIQPGESCAHIYVGQKGKINTIN